VAGWLGTALAFVGYGVTTAANLHEHTLRRLVGHEDRAWSPARAPLVSNRYALEAVGLLGLAVLGGFVVVALRRTPRALALAVLGIALMASSPPAERLENRLVSNPHNYVFVANDEPYRFTAAASRRLWLIGHYKEGAETAGAIVLFAGLAASSTSRRRTGQAAVGDRVARAAEPMAAGPRP
jgi:hypothetical protein